MKIANLCNKNDLEILKTFVKNYYTDLTGKDLYKKIIEKYNFHLNCENNSHGQTIKSQPHSLSITNTSLLPKGDDSTLVSETASATLTNKIFMLRCHNRPCSA